MNPITETQSSPTLRGMNLDTPLQRRRCEAVRGIVEQLREYWPLTLRQLHYQLFSNQVVWENGRHKGMDGERLYQNTQRQYSALSPLLTAMRVQEIVPWEAIEDPTRRVGERPGQEDLSKTVDEAARWLQYHTRCLAQGQEKYIEVWSEKTALWHILERITDQYCIRLASCRGFSSTTMCYDFGIRASRAISKGQEVVLLHVGDFDPSGLAMLPSIKRKMEAEHRIYGITYERPALTRDQIETFSLPHNPDSLKRGDTRSKGFVEQHGEISVELDALHPADLQAVVSGSIEKHIDLDLMEEQKAIEADEQQQLEGFREAFNRLRAEYGV